MTLILLDKLTPTELWKSNDLCIAVIEEAQMSLENKLFYRGQTWNYWATQKEIFSYFL